MSLRFGLALFAAAAAPSLAESAGHWVLSPAANVSIRSESNPRLLDSEVRGSSAMSGELQASLRRSGERSSVAATPRLQLARYRQDRELNRADARFDFEAQWRRETAEWKWRGVLARQSALDSERGTTGLLRADLSRTDLELDVMPTWFLSERLQANLRAHYQASRYSTDPLHQLADFDYRSVHAALELATSERNRLSLGVAAGELSTAGDVGSSRDYHLTLQLQRSLGAGYSLLLAGGPALSRHHRAREAGYSLYGNANRSAGQLSWSAGLSYDLSPNGRGLLTRRGDLYARFGYQFGARTTLRGSLSAVRSAELGASGGAALATVSYGQAELALIQRLGRQWQLLLTANAVSQQVHLVDSRTARGNGAQLGVQWRGGAGND